MRLRNKKTGEVFESFKRGPIDLYFYPNEHDGKDMVDRKTYQSLAELNADWEDYEPIAPLIKDERIRKAVRAWAEANNFINDYSIRNGFEMFKITGHIDKDDYEGMDIEFLGEVKGEHWNKTYTIEELCGEEKE